MNLNPSLFRLTWLLSLVAVVCPASAAGLADRFADREIIAGDSFLLAGNNISATKDAHEPRHAGKIGGHSVWISWIASADGIVTLSTAGSTFDTLLAVYTLEPGNGPPIERLEDLAANDDAGLADYSLVQFGVRAGVQYEIAVDGFAGATGDVELSLDFLATANVLPYALRRSGDESFRLGDTLILVVDIVPTQLLELNWFLNGQPIPDSGQPSLVVRNLAATNLGLYTLRMKVNDQSFFSAPAEIQVNSEGESAVLARNKVEDAQESGLDGTGGVPDARPSKSGPAKSIGGVMRGYDGTQIFNTAYATSDPAEPQHCGIPGGASYWFSYKAPTNGTMTLNTSGSTYDTILAVYGYVPPLTAYADLVSVACDDNSGTNGLTSALEFEAVKGSNYFIVVDGVNAARGIAHLHYHLSSSTNSPPPQPPAITRQPQSLWVSKGTTVAIDVLASGTAPLSYRWKRNGQNLNGETNASLTLSNPRAQDSGSYTVVITNFSGSITSAPGLVTVLLSASVGMDSNSGNLVAAFPATRGYQYNVDWAEVPTSNGWSYLNHGLTDYGGIVWITNSMAPDTRFFRIHLP